MYSSGLRRLSWPQSHTWAELSARLEHVRGTMSTCPATQHASGCPISFRLKTHHQLRFRPARSRKQQQLHHRQSFAGPLFAESHDATARPCQTLRKGRGRAPTVKCLAAAAQAAKPAEQQETVPRGDTAGANLVLENVTVQAGHRDLLEVSTNTMTQVILVGNLQQQRTWITPHNSCQLKQHGLLAGCVLATYARSASGTGRRKRLWQVHSPEVPFWAQEGGQW